MELIDYTKKMLNLADEDVPSQSSLNMLKGFMFNRLKRYNTLLLTYTDNSHCFIYRVKNDIYWGECLPYNVQIGMYNRDKKLGLVGGIAGMTADLFDYFLFPTHNPLDDETEDNTGEVMINCMMITAFKFLCKLSEITVNISDNQPCDFFHLKFSDDIISVVEDDTFVIYKDYLGSRIGNLEDKTLDFDHADLESVTALFLPTKLYLPWNWQELVEKLDDE